MVPCATAIPGNPFLPFLVLFLSALMAPCQQLQEAFQNKIHVPALGSGQKADATCVQGFFGWAAFQVYIFLLQVGNVFSPFSSQSLSQRSCQSIFQRAWAYSRPGGASDNLVHFDVGMN